MVSLVIAGLALHPAFAAYNAAGGYVTLLGHNAGTKGESTFMTNIVRASYGWSDGQDPHSGTNYYCGKSAQLCSPKITDVAFTFPGDSLTIGYRLIALASSTLNIEDFRLEQNGYVMTYDGNAYNVTLQGNLTILGDESKPSWFQLGKSPQGYKIESALKGDTAAYAYSAYTVFSVPVPFTSFATQYVELDDADEYYGTFEVRTNSCLKLASDMPGTIKVNGGGCLTTLTSVKIMMLSLEAGATIDVSSGGPIVVTNDFTAAGVITVKVDDGFSYPQAVLSVPEDKGTLNVSCFVCIDSRLSVVSENGVQTLYAEVLEPTAFNETTGYVTQLRGGASGSSSSLNNIFDEPSAWSDNRVPHADTNYYGKNVGIYNTTNATFAGRSLTLESTMFRVRSGRSVTIADLRVKGGANATSSIFTSYGNSGIFSINGGMTVLSRETDKWPFAFYGGADNLFWISSQKIMGDASRAFELRGAPTKAPGEIEFHVDLLGDLSEYCGTIIVGTNGTLRLGGSSMPGTIRLDTAYSHVDTIASNGTEVKVGKLTSRIGTSISVATTNSLAITDALSVTGTLTKNGGGVLASGGTATAGVDAALNVAEGGLRADSAHAFDGIPVAFADGTAYVRDFAAEDAGLVQYGLYNEAAVTAAGTLDVRLVNVTAADAATGSSVALFTVPESDADALAAAIRFSPRPSGLVVKAKTVPAGGGMTTVMAVLARKGFTIVFE